MHIYFSPNNMYTVPIGHKKIPDKLLLKTITFNMVCNDHLKNNGFNLTKSNIEKYEISNASKMTKKKSTRKEVRYIEF